MSHPALSPIQPPPFPWPPQPQPLPGRLPRRRRLLPRLGKALAYLTILCLSLDLTAEVYFISLNWVNPPVTAYMLEGGGEHLHDYVSLRYVSRYMIAATIAHEDAQLPTGLPGSTGASGGTGSRRTCITTRTRTARRSRNS